MILLGIVLLILGWLLFRPLAYIGVVLIAVGVVLALSTGVASYGYY